MLSYFKKKKVRYFASQFFPNEKFNNFFKSSIEDRDTEKIGFFVSSFFHLSIIFVAIGIPSCFQPKTINIPNIIPIEILTIDEVTRVPEEETKEKPTSEVKEKSSKEVKFTSSDQNEIVKVKPIEEKLDKTDKKIENIQEIKKEEISIKSEPVIEEKKIEKDLEFESLPSKKIKPKIKPKPEIEKNNRPDVTVKVKPKPKKNFSISSVLKDLREDSPISIQKDEDKENKQKDEDKESEKDSNNFTISEIDLLKQQLYACWTVPAGAKGAKDMVVKVRVWVNPDRTVSNARILDTNRMQKEPYFRTVAESALRAVLNPACSPLLLPPEKYEVWKKFIFKFELAWMLGN